MSEEKPRFECSLIAITRNFASFINQLKDNRIQMYMYTNVKASPVSGLSSAGANHIVTVE